MTYVYLSSQWKEWVLKCLLSGIHPNKIAKQLIENGFVPETIRRLLGCNLPNHYQFSPDTPFYETLAASSVVQHGLTRELCNPNALQLYAIDDFLSANECQQVIALTKDKLAPSKLAGAERADYIRTSSTCELAFLDNTLVNHIDQRIVATLNLGVGEGEVIQAQHYKAGQYYQPHFDFFPPGTPQFKQHCGSRGQRTWTCMIYLSDDCTGGHTHFTAVNIKIKPKRGLALFWNNLLPHGEPNLNSIHFAEPVEKGTKTVITKWFRNKN